VGAGKTVTAMGLSLAGVDALNYTVNTTATTTADITALAITKTTTDAGTVIREINNRTIQDIPPTGISVSTIFDIAPQPLERFVTFGAEF
jgi:hypothetical protein